MKICIIGDQHFRFQLPYSTAVEDGRKAEWNAVIEKIHQTAQKCDAVVLLGDNLNSRHNHSSVNRRFVEFINGFGTKHVYIIAGNHERFGEETAIDFLRGMHIAQMFTEPAQVPVIGAAETIDATFLPYMTPGSLGVEDLEQANKRVLELLPGGEVLFHHHFIGGTPIVGITGGFLNEIVLPREILEERYKWVIGGHIHQAQWLSPQTLITGNIFTHEIGEFGKSIFILDTKKKEVEEVAMPVRGIYAATWEGDENSLAHIPDNSIVKCTITERGTDLSVVKEVLKRFDAHIIIEKYPNEREKVILGETGSMDLSLDNLLKVYSEARGVSHKDLKDAMVLLEHDNARS